MKRVSEHKHLGLILDPLLNFAAHFKEKIAKARKGIGLIKHLRQFLPTNVLDQIYKMHVRPHLDYCDFIYHIPELKPESGDSDSDVVVSTIADDSNDGNDDINENSNRKISLNFRMRTLESIQYQAALAVTGAWKGTSTIKIYMELGWESLHHRRYFRRITQFYKIMNGLTPKYLLDPIPMPRRHLFGRHITNDLYEFHHRNKRFLHSFYPDSINCWNKLDPDVRKIETLSRFKSAILKTIKPQKRSIFRIHDSTGIGYIYQLRVGLSPLRHHKKRHKFIDTPNDTCRCGTGIETTDHFLLNCPLFNVPRDTLISVANPIISKLHCWTSATNSVRTNWLLYGDDKLNSAENSQILKATIKFIRDTERFTQI